MTSSVDSPAGRVSSGDVARFRATYAPVLARELVVSPAPSWLPGGRGVALATSAPDAVFRVRTGRRTTIRTVEGTFTVEARDDTTALAALPYDLARLRDRAGARRGAPRGCVRGLDAPHAEGSAESKLVCERDRLPELGVVDISSYVPFLSLSEPEAASWAASRRG